MIKVFLICSGLGNVNRGFESFTQECFDCLSKEPSLDITLFKGGGKSGEKAFTLGNFTRDSLMANQIGKAIGRNSYYIEEASFTLSLLTHISSQQPDIIYFSDAVVGSLLWHWRRLTRQSYKLLLSNGGPFFPPFIRYDYVQQLTPNHFQKALDAGWPAAKQSFVPYGYKIPENFQLLSDADREGLRARLGLPTRGSLVLSVGAINKSHKRMDYIIRETASLPEPRPYLLLLGQKEDESPEIQQVGNRLLGSDRFQTRTVTSNEVIDYYRVADAFVLASLNEGFGRVFLEAMSMGLPCLAHDYEVPRFILGEEGYYGNFELNGSLASLLAQVLAEGDLESKAFIRHRRVYDRFSWEQLRPSYVEMIQRVASQITI